jgi:hypothetical protein
MTAPEQIWKKCSTCKKPIAFGATYYICNVSTCNGLRTGYSFCRLLCFDSHIPGAKHRDAGAIEKIAPKFNSASAASPTLNIPNSADSSSIPRPPAMSMANQQAQRIFIRDITPHASSSGNPSSGQSSSLARSSTTSGQIASKVPQEVLVIASRLKDYIQIKSEFNTSAGVMDVLSHHLRVISDRAIEVARGDGRKTVMERDFDFLKNLK